mgnify:CR=1 FL=1
MSEERISHKNTRFDYSIHPERLLRYVHICKTCGRKKIYRKITNKKFTSLGSYCYKHRLSIQVVTKEFRCSHCGKMYPISGKKRKEHELIHTKDPNKKSYCQVCRRSKPWLLEGRLKKEREE